MYKNIVSRHKKNALQEKLDIKKIETLRKQFLKLMKNVKIVDNFQKASEFNEVMKNWQQSLDDYFYKYLVSGIENLYYQKVITEEEYKHWDKRVRHETWPFFVSLGVPFYAYENLSKEESFQRYKDKVSKWEVKVKREARKAWKVLSEFTDEIEKWYKQPVMVDVPKVEQMEIEGFSVRISGLEGGYEPDEAMGKLKIALKKYKVRAKQVFPRILQRNKPLLIDFKCKLDGGGKWNPQEVIICGNILHNKIDYIVHIIAHEMGHEVWQSNMLSNKAKVKWGEWIQGDYQKLDLNLILKRYGNEKSFYRNKTIKKKDPILYLQIQTLYDHVSTKRKFLDILSMKDLKNAIESNTIPSIVNVPGKPISGYASKNNEEAFCEAFGLLLAYGSKRLLPEISMYLKTILPEIKISKYINSEKMIFQILKKSS